MDRRAETSQGARSLSPNSQAQTLLIEREAGDLEDGYSVNKSPPTFSEGVDSQRLG